MTTIKMKLCECATHHERVLCEEYRATEYLSAARPELILFCGI